MTQWDITTADFGRDTLLEASAGTGKTYSLVRIVREMVLRREWPLNSILIVTFTKMATRELRERIEDIFRETLTEEIWTAKEKDLCRKALADLDQASIFTIHGFCRFVIQNYPFECGTAFDLEVKEDPAVQLQVLRDWLRSGMNAADRERRALVSAAISECSGSFDDTVAAVDSAVSLYFDNPGIRYMAGEDPETDPAWAVLCRQALAEIPLLLEAAKSRKSLLDYDRMIDVVLRCCRPGPGQRPELIRLLRRKYKSCLIDEFQDTDIAQWDIFSTLFSGPEHSLFLIGDPKQSIYGFRGSDLEVYHKASASVDEHRMLPDNYRSCAPMIEGFNILFQSLFRETLNGSPMQYSPVHPGSDALPLSEASGRILPPIAVLPFGEFRPGKAPAVDSLRKILGERIASEILYLTNGGIRKENGSSVNYDDIVILADAWKEAGEIRLLLEDRGIPARLCNEDFSVFDSEAAGLLKVFFDALLLPHRDGILRILLLSPWFHLSLEDIDRLEQYGCFDRILLGLEQLKQEIDRGDFTSAMERFYGFGKEIGTMMTAASISDIRSLDVPWTERILTGGRGLRLYTDMRHLLELLQGLQNRRKADAAALADALLNRETTGEREDTAVRLDGDTPRVRIMTIFKSKGLQFPIVFYTGGLKRFKADNAGFRFFDEDKRICLDPLKRPGSRMPAVYYEWEESKRLFYVALTRAVNRVYLPFCRTSIYGGFSRQHSFWAAMLGPVWEDYIRDPERGGRLVKTPGTVLHDGAAFKLKQKKNEEDISVFLEQSVEALSRSRPEVFCLEEERISSLSISPVPDGDRKESLVEPVLEDRKFRDRTEQVVSFSSLTALHSHHIERDRDWSAEEDSAPSAADRSTPLPAGALFGEMIHLLFEELDFSLVTESGSFENFYAGPENKAFFRNRIQRFYSLEETLRIQKACAELVYRTLSVPLSPLGGINLAQAAENRRPEIEFLLKLKDHAELGLETFENFSLQQGYLKGFIDLVFQYENRYYVLDWKTNYLGDSTDKYSVQAMEASMRDHQYGLQGLLYKASLLKYLELLNPEADSEAAFGGILYLFVRGLDDNGNGVVFFNPSPKEQEDILGRFIP